MRNYPKIAAVLIILMASVLSLSALAVSKTQSKSLGKTTTKVVRKAKISKASPFSYGAWLPYWKKLSAAQEISIHLASFQEISPFSYEVKSDGTPVDKLKIQQGFWPSWLSAARDLRIKIIPTIAWFDGDAIHNTLSSSTLRSAHINQLVALVDANGFNGLDIDYENKQAETKPYFSQFLKELSQKLHAKKKILTCSIEPRTPPSSQFTNVPQSIERANDYQAINRYCDEIRLMAYDQRNIDLLLNEEKGSNGQYYIPVADPAWVEKVIGEATPTISKKKIVLGIPTYGYEYLVIQNGSDLTYKRLHSVTYQDAIDLAKSLAITPLRNGAGELSFTYATTTPSTSETSTQLTAVTSTRIVWFSDASAMADKIKLARKNKLRGVIFFKFDGETDPAIWKEIIR